MINSPFLPGAIRDRAVRLADVEPTATSWLWAGRIPLGAMTLLVSDPSMGKSLLTLDIAARVSRALPWPGENPVAHALNPNRAATPSNKSAPSGGAPAPGDNSAPRPAASVILITSEDALDQTVRPRLEALGADCTRIVAIAPDAILAPAPARAQGPSTGARHPNEARELAPLEALLDRLPDCRLLVIDPVGALLSERFSSASRALLVELAELARRRNLAVVAVGHLRRYSGAAIHRTQGSSHLVSLARTVWAISRDPADPSRRLFLPLKNNLVRRASPLAFWIDSTSAPKAVAPGDPSARDAAPPIAAPRIRWSTDTIDVSIEEVIGNGRPPGRDVRERRQAAIWLKRALAGGARPSKQVQQEAKANGISLVTLRRAFRDLDGRATRFGTLPFIGWKWSLPPADRKEQDDQK